jgi:hypothetical protein
VAVAARIVCSDSKLTLKDKSYYKEGKTRSADAFISMSVGLTSVLPLSSLERSTGHTALKATRGQI